MRKVEITYHVYRCHPETCCHDNHNSWWVVSEGRVLKTFDTKNKAIDYCDLMDLEFTVRVPQWSGY